MLMAELTRLAEFPLYLQVRPFLISPKWKEIFTKISHFFHDVGQPQDT